MPPTWYKTCEAMQRYCEPYFSAVDRWRKYSDEALLQNRLQLMETAVSLLTKYSLEADNHVFDLSFTVHDAPLLPEVVPAAGKLYQEGGDQEAFKASKPLVPGPLFIKIGVFFQSQLLKALAGWNEAALQKMNHRNRTSIIYAIEKLFRVSENAGMCWFVCKPLSAGLGVGVGGEHTTMRVGDTPLSPIAMEFMKLLTDYQRQERFNAQREAENAAAEAAAAQAKAKAKRAKELREAKAAEAAAARKEAKAQADATAAAAAAANKKKNNSSSGRGSRTTATAADSSSISSSSNKAAKKSSGSNGSADSAVGVWSSNHKSVDSKVAAFFSVQQENAKRSGGVVSKIFSGSVERYCARTSARSKDALYHILWEDGDECDYDEAEYEKGVELYDLHFNWSVEHSSVGQKVAAYFLAFRKTPFAGSCVRYLAATSPTANDALYHIVFEDGDECDYNVSEFQQGVALYERINSAVTNSGRKRKAPGSSDTGATISSKSAQSGTDSKKTRNSKSVEVSAGKGAEDEDEEGADENDNDNDISDVEDFGSGAAVGGANGCSSNEISWSTEHDSIGTKVLIEIKDKSTKQSYVGTVTRYAYSGNSSNSNSSSAKSNSQRYYVVLDKDMAASGTTEEEDDLVELVGGAVGHELSERDFRDAMVKYTKHQRDQLLAREADDALDIEIIGSSPIAAAPSASASASASATAPTTTTEVHSAMGGNEEEDDLVQVEVVVTEGAVATADVVADAADEGDELLPDLAKDVAMSPADAAATSGGQVNTVS